ncbi:unnamed protein product [Moneuplotes crassus]|uniref:Uncharacterized protein n=1 Tax=Euplotes crassus TaxID=5936 RepID=A0AAD1Y1E9_EUPCR|nr:unnamed protein product [Moneuplotes crassus]
MFLDTKESFFKEYSDEPLLFGQEAQPEVNLFGLGGLDNTNSHTDTEKNLFSYFKDPGLFIRDSDERLSLSDISNIHAPILAGVDLYSRTDDLLQILCKEVELPAVEVCFDNKSGQIMVKNKSFAGPEVEAVLHPEPPLAKKAKNQIRECTRTSSFKTRVRFSKKHDREMFRILRELCEAQCVSLSCFSLPKDHLSEDAGSILDELMKEVKWRTNRKEDLLRRITKYTTNSTFSVRDGKLLRRLVRSQIKKGEVDYSSLLYYFPGKTAEQLEKEYLKSTG